MKERFKRIGVVMLALCQLLTMLNLDVLAEEGSSSIARSLRAPVDSQSLPSAEDAAVETDAPEGDSAASSDTAIGNPRLPSAEDAAIETDAPDAAPLSGGDDALDGAPQIEYGASGYSGAYDGKAHGITVNVATAGCSVRYAYPVDSAYGSTNPTFTVPGSYTVGYLITAPFYPDVEGSATVTIMEGEISYSASDFYGFYDGQPHSISVNVTSPADATVYYAYPASGEYSVINPEFTDAGNYRVAYWIERQHYETETGVATVAIEKADVTDAVEATLPTSFPYTGSPVSFSPSCDGISSWEISYSNPDGPLDAAPSMPGTYGVKIIGNGRNHVVNIWNHNFTILQEEILEKIEYTASEYYDMYDGQPHSIDLSVTTPGVRATYASSEDGTYTETLPSFTDAGEYTVWFRLEKENCETVISSAEVTIIPAMINFTTIGYEVAYDGKPHSIRLEIATEGTIVTYSTSDDGTFSAELPTFTEVGEYTVWFKIEKKNYSSVFANAMFAITPQAIAYSAGDYSGYYDGQPHSIALSIATEGVTATYATSEDGAYSATLPSFTKTGTYTVWFKLEKENCETVVDSASVTIMKLGKIEYMVSNYSGYYDGKAHTIDLVTTEGVTATYAPSESGAYTAALPSFTETGTYTVWFKLEKAGYETVVDFATVTIMELGKIEYSVQDYSGYDDGEAHSITLNVITEGVTATFATSEGGEYSADMPSFTDIGTYTVWFKLEKEGYETVVDSATVTIAKPGTILYTVEDYSGYYDGKPHSISLNVLTEGVDVTYSEKSSVVSKTLPMFTDPGYYIVRFLLEKVGYATTYGTGSVTIDPGVIEYSARGYSGYADGKAHSIQLYVSTPDAKVSYATSEGGEYSADKPSFSEVGTHTVWYRIEKEHYATVEGSEVVKLLQPKQDSIVYSVEDYVGAYDGEAHTIALDVTTPNVNVTYATSRDGEYGATLPSFTEPGTHTVWFRLKKSGYETSTGSATVTIEKAEQVLYFEQSVKTILPSKDSEEIPFVSHCLCHDQGDGALSWSFSDPDRMSLRSGNLFWGTLSIDVPYAEWSKGYSATVTATAAETDHYKAATATLTIVAISSIQAEYSASSGSGSAADVMHYMSKQQVTNQMQETIQMQDIDLTVRPVSTLDNQSLLSASNELRKKLMASAGASQIGAMAVDAALIDRQTGAELHSTTGDLTLSFTGSLAQSYKKNYKNMACVAVHLKQNSTDSSTVGNSKYDTTTADWKDDRLDHSSSYSGGTTGTDESSPTATSGSTTAPQGTNGSNKDSSKGGVLDFIVSANEIQKQLLGSDNSNEGQFLVQHDNQTLVPVGSLSPTVEFMPCKLTESGVVIKDTSLSPFLLIYGPKEAFSKLLTVRAKDGMFTYDGEDHAVAAEPSIEDGTTLYYSLDLENWQTEAPSFTDVRWNEDGSVGSYQVYVLADNPDCDPTVCSYSVTILPAA